MTNERERMLDALRDDDPVVRARAVDELASLRDPSVVDALVWLMGDDSLWVRCNAAEALGEIRTKQAVEPLIAFLRLGTKRELDITGPPATDPIRFHRFMRRPDPVYLSYLEANGISTEGKGLNLVVSARLALQRMGIMATDALVALLDDPNPYTRYVAGNLLNSMSMRTQPLTALIFCLKAPSARVRAGAALALARLGNLGAVDALVAALEDSEPSVVAAAVDALGTIGDTRAADALAALGRRDEESASRVWAALTALNVDANAVLYGD